MTQDIRARLGGLLALVVAAGFGWFFIWKPLQAAQNHAPEVSYGIKAFVLVPFCLVYGLAFLILGEGMKYREPSGKNFTPLGWAVLVIAVIVSGASFFWFKQQFAGYGYSFG